MTKVTLRPLLANHCSRARHTARECPWPECTDGFTARLAEAIESVNSVMLLTLGRLQAFTMAARMAKFRPPLAGGPIGDFGGFQLGVQPCLLISCLTMSPGGFLQPPYLVLRLPDLHSAFTPPK